MNNDRIQVRADRGSVLVEFSIVTGLLIFVFAMLFEVGIFLLQIQVVNDANRHGSRLTVHDSNFQTDCMVLKDAARSAVNSFIADSNFRSITADWQPAQATVRNVQWDGITRQFLAVSMRTQPQYVTPPPSGGRTGSGIPTGFGGGRRGGVLGFKPIITTYVVSSTFALEKTCTY